MGGGNIGTQVWWISKVTWQCTPCAHVVTAKPDSPVKGNLNVMSVSICSVWSEHTLSKLSLNLSRVTNKIKTKAYINQ